MSIVSSLVWQVETDDHNQPASIIEQLGPQGWLQIFLRYVFSSSRSFIYTFSPLFHFIRYVYSFSVFPRFFILSILLFQFPFSNSVDVSRSSRIFLAIAFRFLGL